MPYSKRKRNSNIHTAMDGVANGDGNISASMSPIDERIFARRGELLQSRQYQLEELMKEHDELIREAFHLDKFVRLLDYDPNVATNDTSQVFLEYKAEHDLLNKSAAAAASQSPIRATRRATTEIRSSLAATISSVSPSPLSTPFKVKPSLLSKSGSTLLKNAVENETLTETVYSHTSPKVVENNIPTYFQHQTKDSGKTPKTPKKGSQQYRGNEHGLFIQNSGHVDPRSTINTITEQRATQSVPPSPLDSPDAVLHLLNLSSPCESTPRDNAELPSRFARPRIHRKSKIFGSTHSLNSSSQASTHASTRISPPSVTQTNLPSVIGQSETNESPTKDGTHDVTSSPTPVKLKIKRVRLFQKPPPVRYTDPLQLPPRHSHGGSIRNFLSSYRSLEDAEDINTDMLDELALSEARTRARIRTLRNEGRLVKAIEDLPPGTIELLTVKDGEEENHRTKDIYDHIISGICPIARSISQEHAHKRSVARKIAKSVLVWHGSRETLEEKQRKVERIRMKALAKFTAKEVEKQWKRAVQSIRDKHKALMEEEEARLGQLHLDAILDRSGMILEAQHLDLVRGRSRSQSGSLLEWSDSQASSDDSRSQSDGTLPEDDEVDASYLLAEISTRFGHAPELSPLDPGDHADQSILEEAEETESVLGEPVNTAASVEATTDFEMSSVLNDDETTDAINEVSTSDDLSESFNSNYSKPPTPIDIVTPSANSSPLHASDDVGDDRRTHSPSLSVDDLRESARYNHAPVSEISVNPLLLSQASNEGFQTTTSSFANRLSDNGAETVNGTENNHCNVENDTLMIQTQATAKSPPSELGSTGNENNLETKVLSDRECEATSTLNPPEVPNGGDVGEEQSEQEDGGDDIPSALVDFAVVPVHPKPDNFISRPGLLRGTLRPYQWAGLEWLNSLHGKHLNGILADEMGLGKTIQTISLLGHLAYDCGIWGPHLIIVPTSVLLNWEMEFKKFLPGFKILPYHGGTKRRKELRVGWNNKHAFNVCVTSYTLASRDAHIFKRKAWYYMVLDEAHMIKNFKSQRWNTLLMFRSYRRLLLTGTPLQNNLTELWSLLQFLMSGTNFANLKQFGDWFANPLEKAIEQGTVMDEETQDRVKKLHTVLRPYLLRRLKADVEKELPKKYEHLVMCRLSKRQRFLYDEFMSRAETRADLSSRVYHKVANILMQLRKVCNHPDLFEVRPIITSFAMPRSAIADYEVKELLIRRRFLQEIDSVVNLELLGLAFIGHQGKSMMQAKSTHALDASALMIQPSDIPGEPPPIDHRTIQGFQNLMEHQRKLTAFRQWTHISYVNELRCSASPVYGSETISTIRRLHDPIIPLSERKSLVTRVWDGSLIIPSLVKSYLERGEQMFDIIDHFAFITPSVVANDLPCLALQGQEAQIVNVQVSNPDIDNVLHHTSVKLQIAFPDVSLVQYDCGKLQELASLLHSRKMGNHRVLIFTQMTKVLDILEIFLNFHGYRYMRLDGTTKIEDRFYRTERFNADPRYFAFIASSRSGGVGLNLTGADTVIFYDSDFNPQMDRQCEDRAHRIGQIRDVHIYRFVSEHTVEEAMLRKADQKRSLDKIVIQEGEFDWRQILTEVDKGIFDKVLEEFVDQEDADAARKAAREEQVREVEDLADFAAEGEESLTADASVRENSAAPSEQPVVSEDCTIADYMVSFVDFDWGWFSTWRL